MPNSTSSTCRVILKRGRAKPFFLHHPWVFSGAIERVDGQPEKGAIVPVLDADGRFIAQGFYNPDSQIAVRLFFWDEAKIADAAFWRGRVEAAVRLRHDVLRLPERTNAYRVVYSEADGIPGLIADRYADFLVAQFLTAGAAQRRDLFCSLLQEAFSPRAILERSDEESAEKEGMAPGRGVLAGQAPDGPVEIASDGLTFLVDLARGQKTGFFLDQRDNRLAASRYLDGRAVLDAFCYTGAFGVTASRLGGAAEVLAVDRSEPAIELAQRNFELNGVKTFETRVAKVAEELRRLKGSDRRFGAVILDPPKFARSRPRVPKALRAYRDVNLLAMQLLEQDGILVSCCCSGHVSQDQFLQTLNSAAVEAGVGLQVLEQRGQAADHPVISSCPETAYLKCLICRVKRD